jgi:hypothetical protein
MWEGIKGRIKVGPVPIGIRSFLSITYTDGRHPQKIGFKRWFKRPQKGKKPGISPDARNLDEY